MDLTSDLVRDSKLRTSFDRDHTIHTYLEADPSRRRITRREYWKLKRRLGQGGYGQVWLEECTDGKASSDLRAVKMVRKIPGSKDTDYQRELEAVAKFSHRKYEIHFVKSFGWFEDTDAVYVAMEYFPLGDLHHYLQNTTRLPVEESQDLTRQILEGINEMHKNGFAHRDLKPANILIKSHPPDIWWVKLADFGISKRLVDSVGPSTVKGTPRFMAPELLFSSRAQLEQYNFQKADMWALGEISFRILTGEYAFEHQGELIDYYRGKLPYPHDKLVRLVGKTGAQLVRDIMAADPQHRLESAEALRHPWVVSDRSENETEGSPIAKSALHEQLERINLLEERTIGHIQEASAKWSTISTSTNAKNDERGSHPISDAILYPPEQMATRAREPVNMYAYNVETKNQRDTHEEYQNGQALSSSPQESFVTRDLGTHAGSAADKSPSSIPQEPPSPPYSHVMTLKGHSTPVLAVSFMPDSKQLTSVSSEGMMLCWDLKALAGNLAYKRQLPHSVMYAAFSMDGQKLALILSLSGKITLAEDHMTWVTSPRLGIEQCNFKNEFTRAKALAISPGGLYLARVVQLELELLDTETGGKMMLTAVSFPALRVPLAFSPNNNNLAYSTRGKILVYQMDTEAYIRTIYISLFNPKYASVPVRVFSLVFSPDNSRIAGGFENGDVYIWSIYTGLTIHTLKGHSSPVGVVAFSPNGMQLVSGSDKGEITLWDAQEGRVLRTFYGHTGCIKDLAFSPDGRFFASASDDSTIMVWECKQRNSENML